MSRSVHTDIRSLLKNVPTAAKRAPSAEPKRRGPKPKPIVEFPEPIHGPWVDPPAFADALSLHMRRHGDSCDHLHKCVTAPEDGTCRKTIRKWANGVSTPGSVGSFDMLTRIERRYRLPAGYFRAKLVTSARAPRGKRIEGISLAEQRRLAWHLPTDFRRRPKREREEILFWIRNVIIAGSTQYRIFQREAGKHRFALRFPATGIRKSARIERAIASAKLRPTTGTVRPSDRDAPALLEIDVARFVSYKTATLPPSNLLRNGRWGPETAAQKLEHLGLMFGALCASPCSPIKGAGIARDALSFPMLLFPAVWDWYLGWREERRGFYTSWEVNMLDLAMSLSKPETGWFRQNKDLAASLRPAEAMISEADIEAARNDWDGLCTRLHSYAHRRKKDLLTVARVHRDPFEAILPILDADSPVGEYRKITEEIVARMPDAKRQPKAAAECARSFLMLRFGLHLGLRQKNLRQLRFCPRGGQPSSERHLELLKCGELRWNDRTGGWEVLIPAAAFKNASSSFFGKRPYRLLLPDLARLYEFIDIYLGRDRNLLLGGATDPGTFFVKSAKRTTANAAYDQLSFYEAWRLAIQRYGIYNPYTGRGAIKGLLPHGPHNVRDVLATHVLKKTGSYEQAGYAIQDSPEIVAKHYGRFFPHDKSALAAEILNIAWADRGSNTASDDHDDQ
jgi:hypothetical protein